MGSKQCGKRRNCSLQAISSFPSVFKRLELQSRKNEGLFGKGLKQQKICHLQIELGQGKNLVVW